MYLEQTPDRWSEGARDYKYAYFEKLHGFPVSGAIFDAPFSLLLLIVIFLIHPLMGAFSLFGLSIALMIGILIEKKVQPEQEFASEKQNIARQELNLMHNNALYCNAMGNLKYLYQKWFINQKQFLVFQAKASSLQSLGQSVSQVVMMVQGLCC